MADIISRLVAGETENRLSLTDEQYGATLSCGSDWNVLRIGMRVSVYSTTNYTTPGTLAIGVCSGTTNMYKDASTNNFVGATTNPAETWSAYNSDGLYTMNLFHHLRASTKVGATQTNSMSTSSTFPVIGHATTQRSCWFITITKGSPNFTISFQTSGYAGTTGWLNRTLSDFETAMSDVTINSTLFNYVGADRTVAVDEGANGALDTLNISWGGSRALEISDLAYSRIS